MLPFKEFSRFQPIELSDPCYERDYIRNLTFYSPALCGRGDVSIFIPPGLDNLSNIPIVLLLHGVYSSHWAWFLKGAAHHTALKLIADGRIRSMIIVSPSDGLNGDGTAYLPHSGRNYEAWICEDLLDCVNETFPCTTPRGSMFISGLSMGGYGALRLGAKYSHKFQGISAHSAVTQINDLDHFLRERLSTDKLLGEELDVVHWMRLNQKKLPPLRFDCGTEDPLFAANNALHVELQLRGIPHQFIANSGDHSWTYWKAHLADTLLFFETILEANS